MEALKKQDVCVCGSTNYGYNFAVCYDCGKIKNFDNEKNETLLDLIKRKEMEVAKLKVRYVSKTYSCVNNVCEFYSETHSLNCKFHILVEECKFYKSIKKPSKI